MPPRVPDSPWIRFPRVLFVGFAWLVLSWLIFSIVALSSLDKELPAWGPWGMLISAGVGSAFLCLVAAGDSAKRDRLVLLGVYGTMVCVIAWIVTAIGTIAAG